jgi:membrane protein involved in colicin uptake
LLVQVDNTEGQTAHKFNVDTTVNVANEILLTILAQASLLYKNHQFKANSCWSEVQVANDATIVKVAMLIFSIDICVAA